MSKLIAPVGDKQSCLNVNQFCVVCYQGQMGKIRVKSTYFSHQLLGSIIEEVVYEVCLFGNIHHADNAGISALQPLSQFLNHKLTKSGQCYI